MRSPRSILLSTTAVMALLIPMIGGADLRGGFGGIHENGDSNASIQEGVVDTKSSTNNNNNGVGKSTPTKSRPNPFFDPHLEFENTVPLDTSNFDTHEFLQPPTAVNNQKNEENKVSRGGRAGRGGGGASRSLAGVSLASHKPVSETHYDSPDGGYSDDLGHDLGGRGGSSHSDSRRKDCTCTIDDYGEKHCVCSSSHKPSGGGSGKGKGKGGSGSKSSSKSGKGGRGKGGGSYSDQNGIGGSPRSPAITKQLEFVMVREEVGTEDSEADFGLSSTIGLNGYVAALVDTGNGYASGGTPIGTFRGACTVVTQATAELLCTYEIALSTDHGDYGLGAILVNGPVQNGGENMLIVTAAEYDFAHFHGGVLKTLADENLPVLYAWLTLYGYDYDDH